MTIWPGRGQAPAEEASDGLRDQLRLRLCVSGETEDELVDEANRHIEEVHPDLAGTVSREDLVAMAEEL